VLCIDFTYLEDSVVLLFYRLFIWLVKTVPIETCTGYRHQAIHSRWSRLDIFLDRIQSSIAALDSKNRDDDTAREKASSMGQKVQIRNASMVRLGLARTRTEKVR
jgi:hypothetical protein